MFITKEIDAGEMLAEHMKGNKTSAAATAEFSQLGHNRDLCPRIAEQIKNILGVYRAYGQEVHDIQCVRDDGVDVLTKYEDRDGNERRVGIQIKSEAEFRKWEAEGLEMVRNLKAQAAEAKANVRIDKYYIILCVDAVRHRDRIRTVCSELKNFPNCEVIEPDHALGFYKLSEIDIWARTVRILCSNDSVLEAATAEGDGSEPDFVFFVVTLVCQTFEGKSFYIDDERAFEIWEEWDVFSENQVGSEDRLGEIIWELRDHGIVGGSGGENYVQVDQLPTAICALYFDLRVRSSCYGNDLRDRILHLIEVSRPVSDASPDSA